MKKILLLGLLASLLAFPKFCDATEIQTQLIQNQNAQSVSYNYYDGAGAGFKSSRSAILTPAFYIYRGQCTTDEANELIVNLGMESIVKEWGAKIYVVNPLEGDSYTEKDSQAFLKLLASTHGVPNGVANIKLIGIEEGATFINDELTDLMYPVAGVMTFGGTSTNKQPISTPVPAYISRSTEQVIDLYTKANESKLVEQTNNLIRYENTKNSLQRVVVGEQAESLAVAFQNAWNEIFSKNYRMHNKTTEFYMADVTQITSDYEIEPIVDFEALGLDYFQMENEPLEGSGTYTWYEYVPKAEGEIASTPLIVTLHGFGNDPRIQGDTSGWPELAAKENLIVVSPEWQAKEENFAGVEGLGEDGVLKLIAALQKKYPQIDSKRVYITGLSAGGSKAALWGAKHSEIFAAAASVSSPGVDKRELLTLADNYTAGKVPYLYLCGDHDFFQMIPVDGSSPYGMPNVFFDDPNVSMFEFIQAYQKINQLPVSETADLTLDPYYGVKLANQENSQLGDRTIHAGELLDDDGQTMIKLMAMEEQAHWNYRPEAAYIWNFFKGYQRNLDDGSLLVSRSTKNEKPSVKKSERAINESLLIAIFGLLVISGLFLYQKKRGK